NKEAVLNGAAFSILATSLATSCRFREGYYEGRSVCVPLIYTRLWPVHSVRYALSANRNEATHRLLIITRRSPDTILVAHQAAATMTIPSATLFGVHW